LWVILDRKEVVHWFSWEVLVLSLSLIKYERNLRIQQYKDRLSEAKDLYTGKPLKGEDLKEWNKIKSLKRKYDKSMI
tara:strand:- start:6527 stop:6757 length:231 start_codon:yes stop_codon:yes gene_type:complete